MSVPTGNGGRWPKGMEVRRMHTATNNFVVKMDGGIVREVGKSVICQPRTSYNGRKTKWYEDKRKKEK